MTTMFTHGAATDELEYHLAYLQPQRNGSV